MKHVQLQCKVLINCTCKPWFTQEINILKHQNHKCEALARKIKLAVHWVSYKTKCMNIIMQSRNLRQITINLRLTSVTLKLF